jgi:uncharacterized protein (DUF302 family)
MKKIISLILLLLSFNSFAEQPILMTRSPDKAEVAFDYSKHLLTEYGYTIAHVQTCDDGMGSFGYHSDFYRVIFFGKVNEVQSISKNHIELVPFLPLKLAIFAEKNETIITALNPMNLEKFTDDPQVKIQLSRWKNDIQSILNELSEE